MFLILSIVGWMDEDAGEGITFKISVMIAGIGPYMLGMGHYLDLEAGKAFDKFSVSPCFVGKNGDAIRYQFTNLPSRPTILAGILGVLFIALPLALNLPGADVLDLGTQGESSIVILFFGMVTWWLMGGAAYYTIHQLSVINRIYSNHAEVNLFRLGPLYIFSNITAKTAIAIIIPVALAVLALPEVSLQPIGLTVIIACTLLVAVTFTWPLIGIHRLMVEEKERREDDASERFEISVDELNRSLDSGMLSDANDYKYTIQSLMMVKDEIQKIPTWPWKPETLRGVIAAVFLPIALWIIQWDLQQLLSVE
ncbi:MAG: hypothetical protein GTO18_13840 [Anaerolineales bacterium]|nr:hypothetical protein [Anaerolineales bacterium]